VDNDDIDFAIRTEKTFFVEVTTSESVESNGFGKCGQRNVECRDSIATGEESKEKNENSEVCNDFSFWFSALSLYNRLQKPISSPPAQLTPKNKEVKQGTTLAGGLSTMTGSEAQFGAAATPPTFANQTSTQQSWSTIANPPTPISQVSGINNVSDILSNASSNSLAQALESIPQPRDISSIATIQPSVQETVGGPPPHVSHNETVL